MSSRAMKKLLRDSNGPTPLKDLEQNATKVTRAENEDHEEQDHDDEEEEEEEYVSKRLPARNLFALVRQSKHHNILYL